MSIWEIVGLLLSLVGFLLLSFSVVENQGHQVTTLHGQIIGYGTYVIPRIARIGFLVTSFGYVLQMLGVLKIQEISARARNCLYILLALLVCGIAISAMYPLLGTYALLLLDPTSIVNQ